jgi:hypothetical protein
MYYFSFFSPHSFCGADASTFAPTATQSSAAPDNAFLRVEIGFHATWALDNVFPCDERLYGHERTDLTEVLCAFGWPLLLFALLNQMQVNVMVDTADATEFLKLGPDGLEVFFFLFCSWHLFPTRLGCRSGMTR